MPLARRSGIEATRALLGWQSDVAWAEHPGVLVPISCLEALADAGHFRAVRCVSLFPLMALLQCFLG